eukprot:CAMPEP_0206620132 /NCGR_PEP_ID=MMETSP0325_2-20121206/61412_1 /ASSEMBLY_ACC=CAM_ASM_000347 /TAXON_ID=2866 /ORGANISM="Crypthecodinium cohnii, Strain Seligo" /LENGTH=134 /DNA_ID=CAMNT_0054142975 /DNA_START=257 /DNA_END=659 /DNA_ORIENTATION=+
MNQCGLFENTRVHRAPAGESLRVGLDLGSMQSVSMFSLPWEQPGAADHGPLKASASHMRFRAAVRPVCYQRSACCRGLEPLQQPSVAAYSSCSVGASAPPSGLPISTWQRAPLSLAMPYLPPGRGPPTWVFSCK